MWEERRRPGIHCSRKRRYFRYISVKLKGLRCPSTRIISGPNIQGLIYVHAQVSKSAQVIRRSEGRPKYSAARFGDVGLCEDWRSRLCELLLMSAVSVDSGDGLPAVPA